MSKQNIGHEHAVNFFDDVARILARPTPRRQALKLLGGAFAGGILSALSTRKASAQTACGNKTCFSGQTCCTTGTTPHCVEQGKTCCGAGSCYSSETCCNATVCCVNSTQSCKNGRCVASAS